jgi:hypothetical protein
MYVWMDGWMGGWLDDNRTARVSTGRHKAMDVDELNASRLRLQLTEVIPKLELTAAEKARPPQQRDRAAAPSSSESARAAGGAGGGDDRLWHSKHFVWYRLPPLQRLREATLSDGVFGPTMSGPSHGLPEDALLLEVFHDGGSGNCRAVLCCALLCSAVVPVYVCFALGAFFVHVRRVVGMVWLG